MDTRWGRAGAIAGIVFAVLFVLAVILPELPGTGESEATVLSFYDDSGSRMTVIVAAYIMAIAGVAFLAFVANLHRGLRAAEGESGSLATVALAGGIVFVAMAFGSASAWAAVPAGMEFGGEALPGRDTPVWLTQLGYGHLLVFGMFAAILTIVSTSLLALRTAVFPRWFAWTGFACAFVLLFGVVFLPMIALPIWAVATSIAMLKSPAGQTRQATHPASAGAAH